MRVGSACLTVLLSGAVYSLLSQIAVSAHMGVGKPAPEENAHRKHGHGNGKHKKGEKKDFFFFFL